eukprot:394809-Rhodomonas_salina.2
MGMQCVVAQARSMQAGTKPCSLCWYSATSRMIQGVGPAVRGVRRPPGTSMPQHLRAYNVYCVLELRSNLWYHHARSQYKTRAARTIHGILHAESVQKARRTRREAPYLGSPGGGPPYTATAGPSPACPGTKTTLHLSTTHLPGTTRTLHLSTAHLRGTNALPLSTGHGCRGSSAGDPDLGRSAAELYELVLAPEHQYQPGSSTPHVSTGHGVASA